MAIDIHFVKSTIDPTGMGEPAYPPVFGALASALYKATGKRFYNQPFAPGLEKNHRERSYSKRKTGDGYVTGPQRHAGRNRPSRTDDSGR